jgi:hypothetical protein
MDQPSANIRIYTPDGTMFEVPVIPETSLRQILAYMKFEWDDAVYIFVNEGGTTMPHLERNMIDYNNWYVEHGYISSFTIKRKSSLGAEYDHDWP